MNALFGDLAIMGTVVSVIVIAGIFLQWRSKQLGASLERERQASDALQTQGRQDEKVARQLDDKDIDSKLDDGTF